MSFWRRNSAEKVIRQSIEEVYPRLWRYCLVITGERQQADDLAQAACLRALEKADQLKSEDHVDRWIFKIAQRLWIGEVRKTAVRRGGGLSNIDEVELMDRRPNPEEHVLSQEVLIGVMKLPEAQRSAMLLVYVEGYSYRDAADVLDIPVGTVMSRLAVARSKLVQTFQDRAEAV